MKLSTCCLFVLCLNALALKAQDFIVPDDGDFVAAVNAANNRKDYNRRFMIFVKAGTYVSKGSCELISTKVKNSQGADSTVWFPSPIVTLVAPKVTIMGEGRDLSIVENRPTYEGISITSTLFVDGADSTIIRDMTLRCNFNNDPTAFANRAVALRERGCKGNYLKNVRLLSTQDTYYTNAGGDTTLDSCDIHGTVDFICGGGTVRFNSCTIHLEPRGKTGSRDVVCAPATYPDEMGYIFKNCTITGSPEQEGRYHLARPWRNTPTCVFLNTRMLLLPAVAGYCEMHGNLPRLFAEYGSVDKDGKAVNCSQRKTTFKNRAGETVSMQYSPVLSDSDYQKYK